MEQVVSGAIAAARGLEAAPLVVALALLMAFAVAAAVLLAVARPRLRPLALFLLLAAAFFLVRSGGWEGLASAAAGLKVEVLKLLQKPDVWK